jgi:hypothetical protein
MQDKYQSAVLRQGPVLTDTLQSSATDKSYLSAVMQSFDRSKEVLQNELVRCCDTNLYGSAVVPALAAPTRTPGTAGGAGFARLKPGPYPPQKAQLQVGPVVALVVPGWDTGSRSARVHSQGAPSALPERMGCAPPSGFCSLRAARFGPCAGGGAGG